MCSPVPAQASNSAVDELQALTNDLEESESTRHTDVESNGTICFRNDLGSVLALAS
ncbi:hypothetical protein CROQUDRAFT_661769 [Cronartium quercuum f. sp. fusiforme G11]|uniref:Uncharacterized protein n=1 Tax=Cronartium quercuum f. sp. fusiforme G11 TaxID=708437 RepID=A0A9P6T8X9_9BASI|nr:hypothetical protein CROQUDRAFT_661769 [Cronartium quercuum f. sp. fusiforme G11]